MYPNQSGKPSASCPTRFPGEGSGAGRRKERRKESSERRARARLSELSFRLSFRLPAPLPSPGNLVGQLALGFPLWFGYKSRVERGDGASARRAPIAAASSSGYGANKAEANPSMWAKRGGAFACNGRGAADVRARQLRVCTELPTVIARAPGGGLDLLSNEPEDALDLLHGLLELDPTKRLTPAAACAHPFLSR